MIARSLLISVILPAAIALAACTTTQGGGEVEITATHTLPDVSTDPAPKSLAPVKATEIRSQSALEKLSGNQGMTLQWISWDKRGDVDVKQRDGVVHLSGSQTGPDGKGRVRIDGDVLSIDDTHFILRGTIEISDTPDIGRKCLKSGDSEFAITQNRKYWRMREFEWCDYLTDYIDIYF